jgi:D-arabinose 1-dehydrogenase-like Zn-dependent alcohol dehydrogenase
METLATPHTGSLTVAVGTAGSVRLESRPRLEPGPGELLLRLRCAGLCGTDLFKLRHAAAPEGSVLGHEVVGTVEALGAGAAGFALGDRIAVAHHAACGTCEICRRGN